MPKHDYIMLTCSAWMCADAFAFQIPGSSGFVLGILTSSFFYIMAD